MNSRLSVLLRENQARLLRPEVAERFAAKLKVSPTDIRFLDLEATDRIERMFNLRKSRIRPDSTEEHELAASWYEQSPVESLIRRIRSSFSDKIAALLHERSSETGAIEVSLHRALDSAFSILEFDGEDIVLTDLMVSFGLSVEYFWDDSLLEKGLHRGKFFRVYYWSDDASIEAG